LAEHQQSEKVSQIGFHRDISWLSKCKKKNTVCQCRSFPNNHRKFSGKVTKKIQENFLHSTIVPRDTSCKCKEEEYEQSPEKEDD
jgi:hypothetical protein